MNYSWFASAYDNDDWGFRVATMVQMVGVIVLALGIEEMFASLDRGAALDLRVMVLGYVVMRLSMVLLWALVAVHAPAAQVHLDDRRGAGRLGGARPAGLARLDVLRGGRRTVRGRAGRPRAGRAPQPHALACTPHRRAARPARLITLGEGVLGTVAALNALVHTEHGWTVNAALLAVAGIGLTFGIWRMYFLVPWGEVLALHRERAYLWGTGHLLLFGSIAATGAGLHVGAYLLEGAPTLDTTATVLTVAVPVAVFVLALYAIGSVFLRQRDPVPPAAAGRYRGRAGARRGLRRAGHERVVVSDGANADFRGQVCSLIGASFVQ